MHYGNGNNKLEHCANANYVRYMLAQWMMLQYNAYAIKIETIGCIGTVLEKKCRKKQLKSIAASSNSPYLACSTVSQRGKFARPCLQVKQTEERCNRCVSWYLEIDTEPMLGSFLRVLQQTTRLNPNILLAKPI